MITSRRKLYKLTFLIIYMITEIIAVAFACYVFVGILLWVIPFETTAGYTSCGLEDYNIWFIFFWLPACFNERLQEAISK